MAPTVKEGLEQVCPIPESKFFTPEQCLYYIGRFRLPLRKKNRYDEMYQGSLRGEMK